MCDKTYKQNVIASVSMLRYNQDRKIHNPCPVIWMNCTIKRPLIKLYPSEKM